jgi:hypothetical protein
MLHDGAVAGELEGRSRSALRSGLGDDSLQHGALYLRSTFEQRGCHSDLCIPPTMIVEFHCSVLAWS